MIKKKQEEMEYLIRELNKASKNYYYGETEYMSDRKFDELENRLKQLEHETGIVLPNSPSNRVGYYYESELQKIQHEYRSLSLDKTKDPKEMSKWIGSEEGVMSWKCDGLTIILTYDNGTLTNAATRGDGVCGEDVTRNVLYFNNVPKHINDYGHIVIRGEAVISYETFKSINKTLPLDKQYKNPRNMAAGALRFKNAQQTANYSVDFLAFDLANAAELGFDSMSKSLHFIKTLGLKTVDWIMVDSDNIEDLIIQHEQLIEVQPYPVDGLVVVYNDVALHNKLGSTKKYPRYAKAFKWRDTLKTTTLRDVEWSVAKTGLLSPVAIFDPVELEGSTIRRANVHNLSVMRELGLGFGDHITVYKANMIIPQINEDIEKTNNIPIPTKCPVCGSTLDRRLGANKKSEFLYCINDDCAAKQ